MYQPPQNRQQIRLFGLTNAQLNIGFLIMLTGLGVGLCTWLFAYGGLNTVEEKAEQAKVELTSLFGRGVPDAKVTVPDTWVAVEPTRATEESLVAELRATNPQLASALSAGLSPLGGLEIAFLAYEPQAPTGSFTTVSIFGQDLSSPTAIPAEMAFIERELPAQGISIVAVNGELTIGGFPAGRVETRYQLGGTDVAGVQYVILTKPDEVFVVTLTTTPDRVDALAPTFQQITETFALVDD